MLNYDFYACIGELQQSSDLDQNQLLPFYLFFATVLVHEVSGVTDLSYKAERHSLHMLLGSLSNTLMLARRIRYVSK